MQAQDIAALRAATLLSPKAFAVLADLGDKGEDLILAWERGEGRPSAGQLKKLEAVKPQAAPFARTDITAPKFQFIDLFAGLGGIRMPFQELGGECVFTSEWDKFAQRSYLANHGDLPHGDITKVAAADIPPHDLVLGGFPCQAFSQAGKKQGFSDTRGTMFFEVQRIMAHHRPKAFLLENVKQLRGHDGGRTLATILSILRGDETPEIPDDVPMSADARASLGTKLNYRVGYVVLNARHFGVPQNRERIYLIGFDKDQVPEAAERDITAEIIGRLSQVRHEVHLGDILERNEDVSDDHTISDRLWAGHQRRLGEHKEKGNGFGCSVFNHGSAYCNTISARYYKDGSEILIDQSNIGKNPRKLTLREAARIQGFPENFRVDVVGKSQHYKQFGNSVAVPVIRAIAQEMAEWL